MDALRGKVAVVVGASRGIGRAMAAGFARAGADVVVAAKSDRPAPRLPGTIHDAAADVRAAGRRALAVKCDVRKDEDVEGMVAKTLEAFGRIDVVVHNAGALWWKPVLETPMRRFDLVNQVNVRGAFLCVTAALRKMSAGHFVLVSPPVELDALPGRVAYCVSKFGMTMLAQGLAKELAARPFSVNCLWPATAIESAATVNFKLGDRSMWRKPEIMADAAVALCATPPGGITGRALLDEDVLRERGVADFSGYRCDPNREPPRLTWREFRA
jgi:citronellol/citronellal dehydrogenase